MYHLAIQPESVITALRDEVQSMTDEYGWTKLAMGQMRLVDSFMKEVARILGSGASKPCSHQCNAHNNCWPAAIDRKVLKDFTFSDGTFVPAGSRISVPSFALHHDDVCGIISLL